MGHTPYGYRIENGIAVIEKAEADAVVKMCNGYLGGLSLQSAAASAGIVVTHCQAKRMMQNKKYLGTDYYPAILTSELMEKVKAELECRATKLGRDYIRKPRERKKPLTEFIFEKGESDFYDPYKRAEFAFGLIKEVPIDG